MQNDGPRRIMNVTVDNFNRKLNLVASSLSDHDESFRKTRERLKFFIDQFPNNAIGMVGPYLVQNAEEIQDQNEVFFLEKNYEEELRDGEDTAMVEMIRRFIPLLKQAYKAATDSAKKFYWDMVGGMLDDYIEYNISLLEEQA